MVEISEAVKEVLEPHGYYVYTNEIGYWKIKLISYLIQNLKSILKRLDKVYSIDVTASKELGIKFESDIKQDIQDMIISMFDYKFVEDKRKTTK